MSDREVKIEVTEEELELIKERADASGITVEAYARGILLFTAKNFGKSSDDNCHKMTPEEVKDRLGAIDYKKIRAWRADDKKTPINEFMNKRIK